MGRIGGRSFGQGPSDADLSPDRCWESSISTRNCRALSACSPGSRACSRWQRHRRPARALAQSTFPRLHRHDDISVSIQEHIEERAEELIDEGMARSEALQMARREFGNVTLIEQRSREVWQWMTLDLLWADLKHVFRRLGKSTGFCYHRDSDARDRHRCEYRGVQRAEQCDSAAAAVRGAGPTCGHLAQRSGRGGIDELCERPAAFLFDVFHLL